MLKADVVVVGAGLSGVLAAHEIARTGAEVLVLDAGPRLRGARPSTTDAFQQRTASVTRLDEGRWPYRVDGARYEWLRVRAVGGRTLLWGGWMDRPDDAYFAARKKAGHPWPIGLAELSPFLARAEAALHVRKGVLPPSLARLRRSGVPIAPKREAVVPGGKRPLTALDLARGLRVVDDALVGRVLVDVVGRVQGVAAWVRGERTTIAANVVVLAASPIETARVLHQSPRCPSQGLGAALHDHLVAGAIAIAPLDEVAARAIDDADPAAGVVLPAANDDVRMTLEVRGPKPLTSLDDEDLATLGFDRRAAKARSLYAVFAMAETDPAARRRVWFDDLRPDALGRPTPVVRAERLTSRERQIGAALRRRVRDVARAVGGAGSEVHLIQDGRQLGGSGHEAGTCVMGEPGRSVVDVHGAVHGVRGLFVADASPLPGALDRHPSLTLAAYALRTARFAAREAQRG